MAGFITEPDAAAAPAVREIVTKLSGGKAPPPNGLIIGNMPRAFVETMLTKRFGTEPWLEQGWQPQQVLPVVLSARDGNRFWLFGLGTSPGARLAVFLAPRISPRRIEGYGGLLSANRGLTLPR